MTMTSRRTAAFGSESDRSPPVGAAQRISALGASAETTGEANGHRLSASGGPAVFYAVHSHNPKRTLGALRTAPRKAGHLS